MKFTFSLLLAGVIAVSSLSTVQAQSNIFSPGDAILGVQRSTIDDTMIAVGGDPDPNRNRWPDAESPDHIIDGVGQKYLNFAFANTGIIVTPGAAASVASSLTLWVANDAIERDPADYELYGSNDTYTGAEAAGTEFALSGFSLISSGPLALPGVLGDPRDANATPPTGQPGGDEVLLPQFSQTVSFGNTTAYNSYMLLFPTVKGSVNGDTIMQVAEVQLNYEAAAVPEPGSLLALAGLGLVGLVRRRKS